MQYKGLDLNLLVVLDALFAEQSITRTGKRVHLSQSATSGALARLRDYFGDDLLVPVGQKMVLTPLAEGLVEPVRILLHQAEAIINNNPSFDPSTSNRTFKIMMSDYSATVLMPDLLPRIRRQAPSVSIELLSNMDTPVESLERGEIDLLILPKQYISANHPSEELFDEWYLCAVWSENRLVGNSISLEQYLSMGHIGMRFGRGQMTVIEEWFFKSYAHQRRIEVIAMAFNLLPQLVVGTNLIATLQARLARRYAEYLPLRLLQPPLEMPRLVEMIQWNRNRQLDPGNVWLRKLFRQVLEESKQQFSPGAANRESGPPLAASPPLSC